MDSDAKPYLLSNSQPQAARRFEALSELFDPWTFHHIEALGLDPTWHCWEIGAGSPTIPKWLSERTAYTLATDIDTSLLAGHFEVVQGAHDSRLPGEVGQPPEARGEMAPADVGRRENGTEGPGVGQGTGGEMVQPEVEWRDGAGEAFGIGRQGAGGEVGLADVGRPEGPADAGGAGRGGVERREGMAEAFGVGGSGLVARVGMEGQEGAGEESAVTGRGGGEVAEADVGRLRGGEGWGLVCGVRVVRGWGLVCGVWVVGWVGLWRCGGMMLGLMGRRGSLISCMRGWCLCMCPGGWRR